MPTYEYACSSCSHHIEVVQAFSDAPLELCSACGGRLRRVFHPAGILFKGSGFYSTDKHHHYRETTKPKLAEKTRDKAADGAAAKVSSSDSGSGSEAGSGSAPKAVEKSA